MHLLRSSRWITFVLFSTSLVPSSFAQSFETRHAGDLAHNPADLRFRLDTIGGQRRYHMGERIPLKLEFSSDSLDKYKLNGATYDRSGRLPIEEFVLDRDDVTDPYQDYFGSTLFGGLAGGLRTYPVLDSRPYKIELDLNDWFRFDRPGSYRLYLNSHRLSRERAPGETGDRSVQFGAVSNIIEIEILAEDTVCEITKLAEIRAILEEREPGQGTRGTLPIIRNPPGEKIVQAARELRFLGTPEAVRLAFQRARNTDGGLDMLLLVGARNRPQMVAEFDRYLADPEVSINEQDIRVRALFALLEKDSLKPITIVPWQPPAAAEMQKLQTIAEARRKRFEEIIREEAIRLTPIVAAKKGDARTDSTQAVAAIVPEAAKAAQLVPPDDYGLSREELIAQFAEFPSEQQSALLSEKWDLVRGPEMVPALRRMIAKVRPQPLPELSFTQVWGPGDVIGESALRRLNELSPQEVVRILKGDIAKGKLRFPGFVIREFPAQDVPQADDALSDLLKTNVRGALPLAAKFATARLAEQMRNQYSGHSWPCAEEEAFVTYFVRVFPEERGEGREAVKQAMANREHGCYRLLFSSVAANVWNGAIEAQAIATLDDSDPEAVTNAVQVLAARGGAGVEAPLWKRLEQWSEHWRGRAAELAVNPITGRGPNAENRLGSALFEAIASAQSWWLDEPRRKRLAELCLDDSCREQWSRRRPVGAVPVEASSGGAMYPAAFRVERYTASTLDGLKRKLQQFPEGTQFQWCPQSWNSSDAFSQGQREEMFKELSGFLSTRSKSIEPCQKNE